MPRKKGDGRGRLGGRKPGTPNKNNPLKVFLRQHSIEYFTPNIQEKNKSGERTGRIVSQFDIDTSGLDAISRADIEIKLLKYHTPQMQATSVDMNIIDENKTLSERLAQLAEGSLSIKNTAENPAEE